MTVKISKSAREEVRIIKGMKPTSTSRSDCRDLSTCIDRVTDQNRSSVRSWFDDTFERKRTSCLNNEKSHEMARNETYEETPGDIAGFNFMGFPDSSNGGNMSKVDSTEEMIANSVWVAMNWPGQILSISFMSSS
jgi:hypothetical protein